MKKILGVVILAAALVSCEKKLEHPLQDSNVMLEEPTVKIVDSAAAGKHEGLALIEVLIV